MVAGGVSAALWPDAEKFASVHHQGLMAHGLQPARGSGGASGTQWSMHTRASGAHVKYGGKEYHAGGAYASGAVIACGRAAAVAVMPRGLARAGVDVGCSCPAARTRTTRVCSWSRCYNARAPIGSNKSGKKSRADGVLVSVFTCVSNKQLQGRHKAAYESAQRMPRGRPRRSSPKRTG